MSDGEQEPRLEELIPIVYAELHRRAHNYLRREYKNRTLQTTELINEAYLKLRAQKNLRFESRTHFFAIASNLMRQILVDHRERVADRRVEELRVRLVLNDRNDAAQDAGHD